MALSENDIDSFVAAMDEGGGFSAEERKVANVLIETVRTQAHKIQVMNGALSDRGYALDSTYNALRAAIRSTNQVDVTQASLTEADVADATTALNEAMRKAQNGQQITQYAGAVLKFVAKIVL